LVITEYFLFQIITDSLLLKVFFDAGLYIFCVVGRKEGFLTGTVSDLPIQPKKSIISAKIFFLAFTAPGFWLLLFGRFGFKFTIQIFCFYYSNFGVSVTIQNGIPYIRAVGQRQCYK
jgi:hypothetical protein